MIYLSNEKLMAVDLKLETPWKQEFQRFFLSCERKERFPIQSRRTVSAS